MGREVDVSPCVDHLLLSTSSYAQFTDKAQFSSVQSLSRV